MRAVVSRVRHARVTVDAEVVGALEGPGLLVLLGVHRDDDPALAPGRMARRLHELRLLRPGGPGDGGRGHDGSVATEPGAGLLVVSQFTLYGDTRKGRRPSWSAAAPAERARLQVEAVVAALRARGATVAEGIFGADMVVDSANDGPFTVIVEV